jgi:heme/copper-type cytochrome/quinol oxidase subunit 2
VQVKPRSMPRRPTFRVVAAILSVLVGGSIVLTAQARRDFDVAARRYSFTVGGSDRAEIRVDQNDLVRVHFHTEDIPHSFTIEDQGASHYRIMRRAEPGKPVSFDFRADTPGRFRFSCTLTIDPKCKEMTGTIIVDPR